MMLLFWICHFGHARHFFFVGCLVMFFVCFQLVEGLYVFVSIYYLYCFHCCYCCLHFGCLSFAFVLLFSICSIRRCFLLLNILYFLSFLLFFSSFFLIHINAFPFCYFLVILHPNWNPKTLSKMPKWILSSKHYQNTLIF